MADFSILLHEDELVNDYEFSERLYSSGLTQELSVYYTERNLIYADIV